MSELINKNIVVMHCLTGIYDGGQETFLVKTFKYISQNSNNSFKFIICSLVDIQNPELIKEYEKNNIELIKRYFVSRYKSPKDIYVNLRELLKLASLIKKKKVDILYGHDFFSALIVRISYLLSIVLFFYKVRKVYVSLHNLLYWLSKYHHFINRILAHFTDEIICVSKAVFDYSLKTDKIPQNKYHVIYNGIDVNEFKYSIDYRNQIKKEYNLYDYEYIIGTVGSISFRKGHIYLIQAFKEFHANYPKSILLIFGGFREIDNELNIKKEVEITIDSMRLYDSVKICKPRLDIHKIYSVFDIFVMPSIVEGFGLSLVEAMSTERIVIASDITPFKEIIEDRVNGLLFRSKDPQSLMNNLKDVTKMTVNERIAIQKKARDLVLDKFNSNLMGQEYAKLYKI